MPWKPEVFVGGKWSQNALVFATEEEALTNAYRLFMRWTLCENSRAVEVNAPVTHKYDVKTGELTEVNSDEH